MRILVEDYTINDPSRYRAVPNLLGSYFFFQKINFKCFLFLKILTFLENVRNSGFSQWVSQKTIGFTLSHYSLFLGIQPLNIEDIILWADIIVFRCTEQTEWWKSLPSWKLHSFRFSPFSYNFHLNIQPGPLFSASRFINLGAYHNFCFHLDNLHKHVKLNMSHKELYNSCPKFAPPLWFPPFVNVCTHPLNIQP